MGGAKQRTPTLPRLRSPEVPAPRPARGGERAPCSVWLLASAPWPPCPWPRQAVQSMSASPPPAQSCDRHSSLGLGPTRRPRMTPRLGVSNLIPSATTFVRAGAPPQAVGTWTYRFGSQRSAALCSPSVGPHWTFCSGKCWLASNNRDLGITAVDHLHLSDEPSEGPQSSQLKRKNIALLECE